MPKSRTEQARQVNVRLRPSDAEVLAAVAFINDRSAAEVVRPVIEEFLRAQHGDPRVKAAIKARADRVAKA